MQQQSPDLAAGNELGNTGNNEYASVTILGILVEMLVLFRCLETRNLCASDATHRFSANLSTITLVRCPVPNIISIQTPLFFCLFFQTLHQKWRGIKVTSRLFQMHSENGAGMKSDFSIQFSLSQTVQGLAFVLWQALFLLPIERAPPGIQTFGPKFCIPSLSVHYFGVRINFPTFLCIGGSDEFNALSAVLQSLGSFPSIKKIFKKTANEIRL